MLYRYAIITRITRIKLHKLIYERGLCLRIGVMLLNTCLVCAMEMVLFSIASTRHTHSQPFNSINTLQSKHSISSIGISNNVENEREHFDMKNCDRKTYRDECACGCIYVKRKRRKCQRMGAEKKRIRFYKCKLSAINFERLIFFFTVNEKYPHTCKVSERSLWISHLFPSVFFFNRHFSIQTTLKLRQFTLRPHFKWIIDMVVVFFLFVGFYGIEKSHSGLNRFDVATRLTCSTSERNSSKTESGW